LDFVQASNAEFHDLVFYINFERRVTLNTIFCGTLDLSLKREMMLVRRIGNVGLVCLECTLRSEKVMKTAFINCKTISILDSLTNYSENISDHFWQN